MPSASEDAAEVNVDLESSVHIDARTLIHADAFADESASTDGAADGSAGTACADLPLGQRIEVLLLAADRPLGDARLVELLGLMPVVPTKPKRKSKSPAPRPGDADGTAGDAEPPVAEDPAVAKARKHALGLLHDAINALNVSYESTGRAFRIDAVASGWQVLTLPSFGPLLGRLRGERQQTRLSQAALETLAIVAYRQPLLRADLESIRGVACGEVLKSLMDRRLVRIVGRAEEVGRPMLYGTTKEFLRIFGIANLHDLPHGRDLKI